MKVIYGKSVLLGIGIGIIITSILGIIFYSGYKPKPSESEIKRMAKEYGMIEPNENQKTLEDILGNRESDDAILITIDPKDDFKAVSEKLYKEGLIGTQLEFQAAIKQMGLQSSLAPGDYIIFENTPMEKIISKITK